MAQLTTTTYAEMQQYCSDACDRNGNPKFVRALKSLMAKFADEVYYIESNIQLPENLDIEIEGTMYVLGHQNAKGYRPELWAISPKHNVPMSAEKAASQQARLARMFNNAK